MMKNKKAFTLAEVLITLTILGVVAAIVIPTMLRNNGEAANRTKMKKAIASYEKVVETMRINEGYQTVDAMKDDMNVAGCEKSRGYFKTKTVDSGDNCIFQASDGLWWNIKNIAQPIVVFEKGEANEYIKDGTYADKTLKDDDAESKKAFYLTVTQGTAAQGYAFIVNDPSGAANKALVYAKIISEIQTTPEIQIGPYMNECTNPDASGENCKNCEKCSVIFDDDGVFYFYEYDENREYITKFIDCYSDGSGCLGREEQKTGKIYFSCSDAANYNCAGAQNTDGQEISGCEDMKTGKNCNPVVYDDNVYTACEDTFTLTGCTITPLDNNAVTSDYNWWY